MIRTSLLIVLKILAFVSHNLVSCDDGVLYSGEGDEHYCIYYNPYFHALPHSKEKSMWQPFVDLTTSYGCNISDYSDVSVINATVAVSRGNCTFSQKARIAQEAGAASIVIGSDKLIVPGSANDSDYHEINITVAVIQWSSLEDIKHDGHRISKSLMYNPLPPLFDPNMFVIFLIAVSNVAIGGFWAGKTLNQQYNQKKAAKARKKIAEESDSNSVTESKDETDTDDEKAVDISIPALLVCFVFVCTFLVLLYFFYDYLVYVVIALFCIAGTVGLYYCLKPIWRKILPFRHRLPENRVPCLRKRPEYRDLVLLLLCLSVSIVWVIERHAHYAWVLQDILGFFFCINVVRNISLPNLKICTIMLLFLFFYDIFFVFISKKLTKDGDSIMVTVATGGNGKSNEQLPMVFTIPKLTWESINVCPLPSSLLGFGDVIIPSLLVTHNHAFDLRVGSKRVYYISTVVSYGVGLAITFVALMLMKTGQPALLYLVPCTLLTTYGIGLLRKEVKKLWNGIKDAEEVDTVTSSTVAVDAPRVTVNSSSETVSGSDEESRELLRK